jgi:hypothetical protein
LPGVDRAGAGVGTRNFVKATMDGNTGFALDPVSRQELATGIWRHAGPPSRFTIDSGGGIRKLAGRFSAC